jgi:hypothetical protein
MEDSKHLKSKEEQEFWDKAFLLSLGKHSSHEAKEAADLAVQFRRSVGYQKPRCELGFDVVGYRTRVCIREEGHKGRCKDY